MATPDDVFLAATKGVQEESLGNSPGAGVIYMGWLVSRNTTSVCVEFTKGILSIVNI